MVETFGWARALLSVNIEGVDKALDVAAQGMDFVQSLSDRKNSILRVLSSLSSFVSGDGAQLSGVFDQFNSLLEGSLIRPQGQASCYLLDIPLLNPSKHRPLPPDITSIYLDEMILATNIRMPGENIIGAGGTYGIYKTIVESIFDVEDTSRPQFFPNGEMGVFVVVYGASTFLPALKIASDLESVFGDLLSTPPDVFNQLPVPQNVKLKPSAPLSSGRDLRSGEQVKLTTGTLTGSGAAVLPFIGEPNAATAVISWDKIPLTDRIQSTVRTECVRHHVYVKEESEIVPGERLSDYEVLTCDIARTRIPLPNSRNIVLQGAPVSAVLTGLDPEKTYYVSVAFSTEVTDEGADPVETEVFEPTLALLSEQVRFRPSEQVQPSRHTRGRAPDWRSIDGPMVIIPEVQHIMNNAYGLSSVLQSTLSSSTNEVSELLNVASSGLSRTREAISSLQRTISRVTTFLETINNAGGASAGLWCTGFYAPSNKATFIRQLGESLMDTSDENAPPFTTGKEPVGALVFVVEGQYPIDVRTILQPVISLFNAGENTSDTSLQDVVDDLSDNPAADAGIEGVVGDGSIEDLESNTSSLEDTSSSPTPGTSASSNDTTSLPDLGVGDDPC